MRHLTTKVLKFSAALVLASGLAANAVSAPAPTKKVPAIKEWSPLRIPVGPTTFNVYGTNFNSDAVVKLDGKPLPTTFVSSTELQVFSFASGSFSGNITVTNPGKPEMMSQARLIEFGQGIVVRIMPSPATVVTDTTQQFVANVTGSSNNNVHWFVDGGAANGTISADGLYRAPATPPGAPVTIRAVSAANREREAVISVAITGPVESAETEKACGHSLAEHQLKICPAR